MIAALPAILIAFDIGDVIGIVVFVVVAGLGLLGQMAGGAGKKPVNRPAAPRPRPGPAPNVAERSLSVDEEIEAFLKQAQQRNKPQAQRPAPVAQTQVARPPQPPRPAKQRTSQPKPGQKPGRSGRTAPRQPMDAEVVSRDPRRGSIAEHVKEHIASHPVSEHSANLGAELAGADERLEGHLHQMFDHAVGDLSRQDPAEAGIAEGTDASYWDERQPEAAPAAALRDLLANPASVRQAIILAEVMRRPDDHWE